MIEQRSYYRAVCDSCGMSIGSFDERLFPGPQDVTRQLLERHRWTGFEEIHHCFRCIPICASCGLDDIECECVGGSKDGPLGHSGDAPYVSREPNVIDGDGSAIAARAYPSQTLRWDEGAPGPIVRFDHAPAILASCESGISCDFAADYCSRCDQPEVAEHRRGEG